MKLKFSQHIFEKYSNIKFDGKSSSGSRVVPCGQTDRSDEASGRFSHICERAENWQQTKCTTDKPVVYVLDTRILGYESDLVRSQRAERYYYIGVALSVKLWERIEIHLHSFVTSESDGSEWSASRPGLFTLEEELRYPLNKRLCGPRCGRFLRREKSLIIR